MSKYTAEQVVTKASQLATDEEYPDKHAADMLRDYAALLREREAAKAGVTAAMVDLAIDVIAEHLTGFGGDLRQGVQSALEAVTPMLASARVPSVGMALCRHCGKPEMNCDCPDGSGFLRTLPRSYGVSRMDENDNVVLVSFCRRLTDDELRTLHTMLAAAPKRGEG